jgi:hypothetical protein
MDIGSAFTFMFDDEEWVKKLAIGGVAILFGIIILPIFVVLGYMLQTLKNVRDGQSKPLPEWDDFSGLLVKGLMVFLIALVYSIPILIFVCLLVVIQLGFPQDGDISGALAIVWSCLLCVISFVALLINIILPAAIIRYAQFDTFGSAFQFGEIFSFIKNNIGNYIIVLLLGMVAGLVAEFGFILCIVGIFFTAFWSMLVQANLYGQLAREMSQ